MLLCTQRTRAGRRGGRAETLEGGMATDIPSLIKDMHLRICEAQSVLGRTDARRATQRYVMAAVLQPEDQEDTLRVATHHTRGVSDQMMRK